MADLKLSRMAEFLDDTYLHLILFPTEKCNFRCTYCYEDFIHGQMDPSVVEGVKRLIGDRVEQDLRRLDISWFGGEPLLAKRIVLEIARYASDLAKCSTLSYRSNMTTNGALLDSNTCGELVSAGVTDFQISLDGWGDSHDRTRKRISGSGTFAQIWSNLCSLRRSKLDFQVLLRVHFSPANIDNVPTLVAAINRELRDSRFRVHFHHIGHLGGPRDSTFEVFDYRRATEIGARLRELLVDSGQEFSHNESEYVCYAARPNSLTIRANGIVGKCTVALNDLRNSVGRICPDGTVDIDQDRVRFWIRGLETGERSALACPLHGA
jgi:uncharacterized protein